jgi:hypothetical protein
MENWLLCKRRLKMTKIKIAIIAIARLENDYLKEWIEYHLDLGFSHIYIYDNSFGDEEKINYEHDCVTIIPAYNKIRFQKEAYTEGYEKYNSLYDYVCFIDIDEFVKLNKNSKIQQYLSRCPRNAECIRINWQCYDDSGMIKRDTSVKVMEAFTNKIKTDNHQSKSIIISGLSNIIFNSPHHAVYKDGNHLITYDGNFNNITDYVKISAIRRPNNTCIFVPYISYDLIQINHYRTKTLDEYMRTKLSRDDADRKNYARKISKEFFKYNQKTLEKIKYYNEHKKEFVKNKDSLENFD